MATTDIIYDNVGGSMNNMTELLRATAKLRPKIYAIGECPLENEDWMHLEEFTCYANTIANRWGCAVYIRNK